MSSNATCSGSSPRSSPAAWASPDEPHQQAHPPSLELGDAFPDGAGMGVELGGGGGEEAPARKDAPLDVREELLAERLDPRERASPRARPARPRPPRRSRRRSRSSRAGAPPSSRSARTSRSCSSRCGRPGARSRGPRGPLDPRRRPQRRRPRRDGRRGDDRPSRDEGDCGRSRPRDRHRGRRRDLGRVEPLRTPTSSGHFAAAAGTSAPRRRSPTACTRCGRSWAG